MSEAFASSDSAIAVRRTHKAMVCHRHGSSIHTHACGAFHAWFHNASSRTVGRGNGNSGWARLNAFAGNTRNAAREAPRSEFGSGCGPERLRPPPLAMMVSFGRIARRTESREGIAPTRLMVTSGN